MDQVFKNITETEISEVVSAITNLPILPHIICLEGDLGTGKTTLVKLLLAALGSKDEVNSPTFSLIHEYSIPHGKVIHTDWYRIKNIEELYDAGMQEYLDSEHLCIVEWPQVGAELLKDENYLKIEIEHSAMGRNYHLFLN